MRGLRTSMDVKIPQLRGRGSFFTEATRTFRETLVSSVEPSYAYDTEIDVVLYVIALAFRRSVTQYRNFDAKDKYKDLLITEKSDSKLLAKLHIRKLPISFALLKDSLDLPVFVYITRICNTLASRYYYNAIESSQLVSASIKVCMYLLLLYYYYTNTFLNFIAMKDIPSLSLFLFLSFSFPLHPPQSFSSLITTFKEL